MLKSINVNVTKQYCGISSTLFTGAHLEMGQPTMMWNSTLMSHWQVHTIAWLTSTQLETIHSTPCRSPGISRWRRPFASPYGPRGTRIKGGGQGTTGNVVNWKALLSERYYRLTLHSPISRVPNQSAMATARRQKEVSVSKLSHSLLSYGLKGGKRGEWLVPEDC